MWAAILVGFFGAFALLFAVAASGFQKRAETYERLYELTYAELERLVGQVDAYLKLEEEAGMMVSKAAHLRSMN